MHIRQLQIAHDTLQDRLLLRIATQGDDEFRVWLTRRFVRDLWPYLAKGTDKLAAPPASVPAAAPAAKGIVEGSFAVPFKEDTATYPLGLTPLLPSEIKVDTLADGTIQLTFREGRERRFVLPLGTDLIDVLCAMLRAAVAQAEWSLALDAAPPGNFEPATPRISQLH